MNSSALPMRAAGSSIEGYVGLGATAFVFILKTSFPFALT
jgi:hypothetical protein